MRLRLWQRLFLAFAALSGTALAGFAAWQQQTFRMGFLAYLNEVEMGHLRSVSERLAAAYASEHSWEFLRRDPARFRELINSDRPRPAGRMPAPRQRDLPPPPSDREWPPARRVAPPPPPGGGRPRPGDVVQRSVLLDAAGDVVVGNPTLPPEARDLPLTLDGERIGTLRVAPLPQLRGDLDLDFARAQLRRALVAGLAVMATALVLAFALARWLLKPVRELAAGTLALAAGDYARRVPTRGDDEFAALGRDFNHLAATLERHRQSRQRWGADIAHELRTPLAVLRGEIQALQDGVRRYTPEALESLRAECDRMGALVEDLYQLALADAGALEYRFEAVDLANLVTQTLAQRRDAFADAGLALEQTLATLPEVRADPRRIAQLLDNLLANARRYTDAPGRVRVELTSAPGHALLSIDDSAPGVRIDLLPRLFERLFRVDADRGRDAGGAGLGLAICLAIVEAHGGRIEARRSALGGVRIEVRLPWVQES